MPLSTLKSIDEYREQTIWKTGQIAEGQPRRKLCPGFQNRVLLVRFELTFIPFWIHAFVFLHLIQPGENRFSPVLRGQEKAVHEKCTWKVYVTRADSREGSDET